MPHLDHTGPEAKGSKTGRKLGTCPKTQNEKEQPEKLGIGLGKRHHSGGGNGLAKRLRYNIN
jgi:hypothetical protein